MSGLYPTKIIALMVFVVAFALSPARASTELISQQGSNDVLIKAEKATYTEIMELIASKFALDVVGKVESENRVTIGVSGSLKQVLGKILGQNNFMLMYKSGKPSKIVLLDNGPPPTNNRSSVKTAAVKPLSTTPAPVQRARQVNTQPRTPTNAQNTALLNVMQQQSRVLLGATTSASKRVRPTSGSGLSGQAQQQAQVKSLIKDSSTQLQSLVSALKALCPAGQKC